MKQAFATSIPGTMNGEKRNDDRQLLMKFKDFLDFSYIPRRANTRFTLGNYIARYACRYVCSCVTLIACRLRHSGVSHPTPWRDNWCVSNTVA